MSHWFQRVSTLFGARPLPPAARPAAAPAPARAMPTRAANPQAAPPPAAEPEAGAAPDLQQPFFEWLLDTGPAALAPLSPAERRLLARLDAVLASDTSRTELLPRAPAVIPQLLNSLRDESQSSDALARRVAKDPHLVAEVIRLANGALTRAAAPVTDLPQAIARLGTEGLRRVIARVVLKPLFDAQADTLSARAAPKLWLHSEAQAAECMKRAAAAGLDPFEGYLAGLMHNIGWTAALRVLDRAEGGTPGSFSREFVQAFESRRELFFALLVMPWQLTESLTALAVEMLDCGLAATTSPLGQALHAADRSAALAMLGASVVEAPIEIIVSA